VGSGEVLLESLQAMTRHHLWGGDEISSDIKNDQVSRVNLAFLKAVLNSAQVSITIKLINILGHHPGV
jgi:hypothetical protein